MCASKRSEPMYLQSIYSGQRKERFRCLYFKMIVQSDN